MLLSRLRRSMRDRLVRVRAVMPAARAFDGPIMTLEHALSLASGPDMSACRAVGSLGADA